MRVRITRRGGLAGIALTADLDTASFDRETAALLEEALEELVRGGENSVALPHPDAFDYEIVLLERGRSARVTEPDVPPELRPLLRELTTRGEVGAPTDPDPPAPTEDLKGG